MVAEKLFEVASGLPGVTDDEAFGPGVTVLKVEGKVFAVLGEERVTLKCEPGLAVHLRGQYAAVGPGYHMNKRHWITVVLDSTVPDEELREMVEHSWERVVAGMPRAARERLSLQRG
ncbi:MmcQ/YjbR family DNA-binding protein [Kitasatospora purpeofusca]|uniref:MmcQ/YjbR family DNA-binding protein n=1 Tax=Kitasatospora purpeofusca TaxID=67352 RepID=UPI0036C9AF15